ncbi:unnamed protein product, partial [Chrysoparadoxa australica]
IEKRGRKGYLLSIGDEPNLDGMTKTQIKRFLDIDVERDLSARDILDMAQQHWEVFHIVLVNEGRCRYGRDAVLSNWKATLPERTIELQDVNALAETVVSLIQVTEGARASDVAATWSGETALVVANALSGVPAKAAQGRGVQRL